MHKIKHNERGEGFEPRPHQLLPVEIKETWLQKLLRRLKDLFGVKPNYAAQY